MSRKNSQACRINKIFFYIKRLDCYWLDVAARKTGCNFGFCIQFIVAGLIPQGP